MFKKNVRFWAALVLFCMLVGLVACEAPDQPESDPSTDVITEQPTQTESESESETETETEGQKIEITPESPTDGKLITFYENSANETILDAKYSTAEIVKDGETSVLKLTTAGEKIRNPYMTLDYATYMNLLSLEQVAWNDCAFAVVTLKTENVSATAFEITMSTKVDGTTSKAKGSATYNRSSKDWQTVIVPFSLSAKDGAKLTELKINFVDTQTAGETVYIKSIAFAASKVEVLEMTGADLYKPGYTTVTIPGLSKEYTLLQVSDLHSAAFSAEESKAMDASRRSYITGRRNSFTDGLLLSEERMPYMFGYADEIGADLMLLTGDIIDFPSEMNVTLMRDTLASLKTPALYSLGNHDWCYADDYLSTNAAATYIPALNALSAGEPADDPYVKYVDFGEFMVVSVDNSTDSVTAATVDKFLALCRQGKPIILMLHVPLHVDSLVADCTKVWGKDLGMGGDTGVCAWSPDVQRFYAAVAEDENSPVVAVFAGHVHFNHEDVLPNGVSQYITSTAYTGDCRVITVKGE